MVKKRFGEMLLEAGVIRLDQLSTALAYQKRWGGKIASVLVEMGIVNEKTVAPFLERQVGWKCITLDDFRLSPEVLNLVKPDIIKKYHIIPLNLEKKTLTIAISDPADCKTIDELAFLLGLKIKTLLAVEYSINKVIYNYYSGGSSQKIKG